MPLGFGQAALGTSPVSPRIPQGTCRYHTRSAETVAPGLAPRADPYPRDAPRIRPSSPLSPLLPTISPSSQGCRRSMAPALARAQSKDFVYFLKKITEIADIQEGMSRQSPERGPGIWPGSSGDFVANFPKVSPRNLSTSHKVCQGNRQSMPPGIGQDSPRTLRIFPRSPQGTCRYLARSAKAIAKACPWDSAKLL